MIHSKRISFLTLATLIGSLFAAGSAQALILQASDEIFFNEYVTEDVYLAGGNVTIQQDIDGDLYIGGGNVTVNGIVGGDLVVAGGNVIVNETVRDDLRMLGGSLSLNADVEGDLIALGGNVDINKDTMVQGDLVTVSGATNLYGTVNKNVRGTLGRLVIGGQVNGDVNVRVTEKLVLLNTGHVAGNVTYFAPEKIENHGGAIDGETTFNAVASQAEKVKDGIKSFFNKGRLVGHLWGFFSFLLLGLIFIALFPNFLHNASVRFRENGLKSFGVGFLMFVLGGILAMIALVVVIGIQLGFILLVLLFLLGELGRMTAAYWAGTLIVRDKTKGQRRPTEVHVGFWKNLGTFALGLLILKLIGLIPFVGWVVSFITFLVGAGAVVLTGRDLHKKMVKEKLL